MLSFMLEIEVYQVTKYCTSCSKGSIYRLLKPYKYIILSENMKCIPNLFFRNCAKLKYLDIPSTVKEIKFNAFRECISLEGISLPDTLSTILKVVFSTAPV